ncbi:MAG: sigma-70 family RNA polymerase sigma factor [Bacteroidales bacterium]|nr:sigma-70 family RNA polymerase sigma factor [Bacteroidales bacterium]
MKNNDSELIEGCIRNDRKSQKELYERYSSKMLGVCFRYTNSTEEAEDAMVEGFMNVFTHIASYRQECALETWIRKIMVNSALSHLRQRNKHLNISIEETVIEEQDNSIVKPEEKFAADDLMKLIQKMPDGYKVIFNLFAVEGFSHKEIAEQLNISESTSKSQFFRARKWLMERIKNE